MGYLVTAHVIKSEPDLARLEALPKGIAWAAYRESDASAWYLDTFEAGRNHEWPFTSLPVYKELPRDLPDSLGPLSRVHAALKAAKLADGFVGTFLNLNLLLSRTLQLPVLSFCSDDEGVDFACLSEGGVLRRLRCNCYDIVVTFSEGKVAIQPLQLDDDDVEQTDLSALHDPVNGISVMERKQYPPRRLHQVACEEAMAFLGTAEPPLGIGSFDGIRGVPPKIAASAQFSASPPPVPGAKPGWKVW
jgi:hypothetical protein